MAARGDSGNNGQPGSKPDNRFPVQTARRCTLIRRGKNRRRRLNRKCHPIVFRGQCVREGAAIRAESVE